MRGKQSECAPDQRWNHIHAERSAQEVIGIPDPVARREAVANEIGQHRVTGQPVPCREDQMQFAAEDQDHKCAEAA